MLERFIVNHRPAVIVDHVEIVNPGTALAMLAHKYRIPFVQIPMHLVADRSVIPSRASHYCLWGKDYRDWYSDRGIDPAKISLTGNNRFAYTSYEPRHNKKSAFDKMNTGADQFVAVYTVQPFHQSVLNQVMKWMYDAVCSIPNLTVWVKPHPSAQTVIQPEVAHSRIKVVPSDLSLADCLHHADALLTISSNTAIEAAFCEKPIIVLQPDIPYHFDHHNNTFNSFLVQAKAGPAVYNGKQLKRCLHRLTRNSSMRDNLCKQSKRFLERTLQHIENAHIETANVLKRLMK